MLLAEKERRREYQPVVEEDMQSDAPLSSRYLYLPNYSHQEPRSKRETKGKNSELVGLGIQGETEPLLEVLVDCGNKRHESR